jgi:hypothetical protein
MRNKWLLPLGSVMVTAICASAAFGGAPLGPPVAGLDRGQFRAGAEYFYGEMDLDWDEEPDMIGGDVEDLATSAVFGSLGYGLTPRWEACVRLGAGSAELDMEGYSFALPEAAGDERLFLPDMTFDGDYELAWGFATKYTFWQQRDDLSWGVIFQMTWFDWDDRVAGSVAQTLAGAGEEFTVGGDYAMGIDLDCYDIKVALGPAWQATDRLCLYGGPFLHYVRGQMDVDFEGSFAVRDSEGQLIDQTSVSLPDSGDLEQKSQFGGFAGGQLDVSERMKAFAEVMLTGDAWGIGVGGGWRF